MVAIPRPVFLEEGVRRSLYARLVRVDFLSDQPYRRAAFEFDGIDADDMDDAKGEVKPLLKGSRPFALAKIVTTPARFEEVLGAAPIVGTWFRLKLDSIPSSGLMTWHAQLGDNGYYQQSRTSTVGGFALADPLAPPAAPAPASLGAAGARPKLPKSIAELSRIATVHSHWSGLLSLLSALPLPEKIVVRDVGQASFCSFLNAKGESFAHFDTGLPVSWNGKTAPSVINVTPAKQQTVILSHFDWDHLHAPYTVPALLDANWIVPSQRLGPGAARLALIIARKGNLHVWPTGSVSVNPLAYSVGSCLGPVASINDTGLAIRSVLASGKVALLTGDVDYSLLPKALSGPCDHLLVSHHGARMKHGSAAIPIPNTGGAATVSYGSGNTYRHPNQVTKADHSAAGWGTWNETAGIQYVQPRGDRFFV
ncbi:metallo-hydrolase/oxidoreductase [Rhizobium leguminosarum]|uniref:metallo-hydrolase/oxidoreductase n=1 Tax=Rhizobium leguminosarum TaxID=384 RepID=UPI001030A70A|nr:metallo-hydrolase/oxidoreductase [Rhizobium leguminosarum]TAX97694.1 metallo-hydrolase/oxidoreductase [Rhizobium leguminosarum]